MLPKKLEIITEIEGIAQAKLMYVSTAMSNTGTDNRVLT